MNFRLARCEGYDETKDRPCGGLLAFQPGDLQAACSRCQGWCGWMVADYIDEPPADPPTLNPRPMGRGYTWGP